MDDLPTLHAVAIAGGSGTRFWPLSRHAHPKQLLNLSGEDTLLHATLARMSPLVGQKQWWMVVGQAHAQGCREAVAEVAEAQVLVEPQARNTAPAIALAAIHLLAKDEHAVMAVLPADHHVGDGKAFRQAIEVAHKQAATGRIMTLGITPSHAETGFGYIEQGPAIGNSGAFALSRFVEKPSLEKAQHMLAQKNFLWNAGIFVMQAKVYMDEVKKQLPALASALAPVQKAIGTPGYADALKSAFAAIEGISIDYGIMEKAPNAGVVPVSCGWSDVGSWNALGSVVAADAQGNVVRGRAILQDTHNSVAWADDGHMVAVLGMHDVVVVHTADATLVLPKSRSQEVRDVLTALKEKQWTQYQ